MKSFNNIEIEVWMDVIVLQTPIVRWYEFLKGKVVALTKKMVQVEVSSTGDRFGFDKWLKVFKRQPEQVIVVV